MVQCIICNILISAAKYMKQHSDATRHKEKNDSYEERGSNQLTNCQESNYRFISY